jgi:hypothetical protein
MSLDALLTPVFAFPLFLEKLIDDIYFAKNHWVVI